MNALYPLTDVRVVDFTMGWSGPLATRHLADMGAEVIKIESCTHPDWWRGWELSEELLATHEYEKAPHFNQINRNKIGVAIDLTRPDGKTLALKLIARADAVIENQTTGVMTKLGLSFEELKVHNSEIIMLSMPAFGAVGPWATYRGYGSTVEQGAGLPHLTGVAEGPPIQTHIAYGDACAGLNAAAALLVALYHKKRTGTGQRIEISQVECMLQLGVHGTIAQGMSGAPPPRTGNRHPMFVPHGCFQCVESDTWIIIVVTDDSQWPTLCKTIGRPDLANNPSLSTSAGRREHEDLIEKAILDWSSTRDSDVAMQELQGVGVAAGVVRRPTELLNDENFEERGFWLEVERKFIGSKPYPATPWKFNAERGRITSPAPLLGEHNKRVLCEMLGISRQDFDALEKAGVIGDKPVPSAATLSVTSTRTSV